MQISSGRHRARILGLALAALAATTRAELAALPADLPRRPRPDARAEFREHLRTYLSVMALLIVIWALTGMGYFWPVWPILGWGSSFVMAPGRLGRRCGRRSFNPGYWTGRQRS